MPPPSLFQPFGPPVRCGLPGLCSQGPDSLISRRLLHIHLRCLKLSLDQLRFTFNPSSATQPPAKRSHLSNICLSSVSALLPEPEAWALSPSRSSLLTTHSESPGLGTDALSPHVCCHTSSKAAGPSQPAPWTPEQIYPRTRHAIHTQSQAHTSKHTHVHTNSVLSHIYTYTYTLECSAILSYMNLHVSKEKICTNLKISTFFRCG